MVGKGTSQTQRQVNEAVNLTQTQGTRATDVGVGEQFHLHWSRDTGAN